MTLIASRNPAKTRKHTVAGQEWLFTRVGPGKPLTCEVTDPVAVDIFLSPRNTNLFYAPETPVLTRAAAPAPTQFELDAERRRIEAETSAAQAASDAAAAVAEATKESNVIRESIELMLARRGSDDDFGDFTGEGIPNCNNLAKLCGFTVKKDAMLAVWNTIPPPADAIVNDGNGA